MKKKKKYEGKERGRGNGVKETRKAGGNPFKGGCFIPLVTVHPRWGLFPMDGQG